MPSDVDHSPEITQLFAAATFMPSTKAGMSIVASGAPMPAIRLVRSIVPSRFSLKWPRTHASPWT
ncbi:hypothetical protein D3C71_1988510 [compost metagenome]